MIDIQISGTLPQIPDTALPEAMMEVRDILVEEIQQNFIEGGRPVWALLKNPNKYGGTLPLWGNMGLFNSIHGTAGADWAEVAARNTIHQEGGYIPPVEGKLMAFEMNGHTIFTYRRKGFDLPARPYMMLTDGGITRILKAIPKAIISRVQTEPIA